VRIKIYTLSLFLLAGGFIAAQQIPPVIQFERPDKQRLEQEIATYKQEKSRKRIKRVFTHGALGVGGLTGLVGVGYAMWGSGNKGNTTKEFVGKFKDAVSLTLAVSMAGAVVRSIFIFGAYVLDGLWGKNITSLRPARTMIKRLDNTLTRIDFAVQSLREQNGDEASFQFQLAELVSSFSLFIRSLEKCCAIITVELQAKLKPEDPVLQNWADAADRLFVYCDALASRLQNDVDCSEWDGFSSQTTSLLGGLEQMMLGAFGDVAGIGTNREEG